MLDEEVVSVSLRPREFTYDKEQRIPVAIFRLDFIALIKTNDGENKKVLIEIQKAKNEMDLMRFRNYVAEQYKKQEIIDGEEVTLPIITIYILGFELPYVETACIKIKRQRITGRYKSKLDKLLSVFEQDNFIDDTGIVKDFKHEADVEELQIMTDILHHVGVSPEERKEIEDEKEAYRTYLEMFQKQKKEHQAQIEKKNKELKLKDKELEEKDKQMEELRKQIIALEKSRENNK